MRTTVWLVMIAPLYALRVLCLLMNAEEQSALHLYGNGTVQSSVAWAKSKPALLFLRSVDWLTCWPCCLELCMQAQVCLLGPSWHTHVGVDTRLQLAKSFVVLQPYLFMPLRFAPYRGPSIPRSDQNTPVNVDSGLQAILGLVCEAKGWSESEAAERTTANFNAFYKESLEVMQAHAAGKQAVA